jgi:hypothetical protein
VRCWLCMVTFNEVTSTLLLSQMKSFWKEDKTIQAGKVKQETGELYGEKPDLTFWLPHLDNKFYELLFTYHSVWYIHDTAVQTLLVPVPFYVNLHQFPVFVCVSSQVAEQSQHLSQKSMVILDPQFHLFPVQPTSKFPYQFLLQEIKPSNASQIKIISWTFPSSQWVYLHSQPAVLASSQC